MDVLAATNNAHKLAEIKAKLEPLGIRVFSLQEKNISCIPEETGSTFRDNALAKARAIHALAAMPVLADDSGLTVEALHGAPGVWSARYAGEHADDAANNARLLSELADVPPGRRQAAFVCALAFIDDRGEEVFEGHCPGEILTHPVGENGFGYDPLFFLPKIGLSMAELPMEKKNTLSHRARALCLFAEFAKKELTCV